MTNATSAVAVAPSGPFARFDRAMHLDDDGLRRLRAIAVVGIVLLNVCDLLLTRHLLSLGAIEANPLMALFIAGFWGIVIKLALPVAIGTRNLLAPLRKGVVLALCFMCVLYSGVVLWNSHLVLHGFAVR
jgi:hypothetical protein